MRHLVRIALPSLLGQGLDKLLDCLAIQLDVGPRLFRALLGLVRNLRSGPARGDVGAVEENVDEFECIELIHLWPVAEREPHRTHDVDTKPSSRVVQANRCSYSRSAERDVEDPLGCLPCVEVRLGELARR